MFNRPIALQENGTQHTASELSIRELLEIEAGFWEWSPGMEGEVQAALERVRIELIARALGLSTAL